MMRYNFDKELESLHLNLLQMAGLVEESIESTIEALKKHDVELAKKVAQGDNIIDKLEKKIEKQCIDLIARQQPLAKDLRTISSVLKIITDLERIADQSADIASYTIKMAREKYIKPIKDIPKMAECTKNMVNRVIDAYIKQDIEEAKAVIASDDEVDDLFAKIVQELTVIVKNNPQTVEQAINLVLIAKYLERMADHTTNIGEWIIYNVTGEHYKV
mgnify:FL=1|jgi:phosphate transport system protein